MIDAIIFDFDGVILDTETPLYETWAGLYAEFGHDLPVELWHACLGRADNHFDFHAHLVELVGDRGVDVDELEREVIIGKKRERSLKIINAKPVMAGVIERAQEAKAMGMGVGVCSSSSRSWVGGHLERLGVREHFQAMVVREDTPVHKPKPDPYLHAAERLGVTPERTLVFEDTPNGIKAAKAAGMYCVALPNDMTRPLDLTHADLIVEDLGGVGLGEILSSLGG
ncbi:MAG: HAD family hydrolase [Planctomycetota bacterium]|jgi:HAD superfamily hydrolase (TIGR01509 family)